jgi:hypothetical protein
VKILLNPLPQQQSFRPDLMKGGHDSKIYSILPVLPLRLANFYFLRAGWSSFPFLTISERAARIALPSSARCTANEAWSPPARQAAGIA